MNQEPHLDDGDVFDSVVGNVQHRNKVTISKLVQAVGRFKIIMWYVQSVENGKDLWKFQNNENIVDFFIIII